LQRYLDHVCPVEAISAHIYAELRILCALLDFFTTTRLGTPKGIIVLIRV